MTRTLPSALIALTLASTSAAAGVCDFKPSRLAATAVLGTGGAMATGAGMGMQAAGYYTLVHASSGLTMLGSTAAGASAAGTAGILAGTGGLLGSAAAAVMSPLAVAAGGVLAVGAGGLEGVCYFQIERVTDYDRVLAILTGLDARADPDFFRLDRGPDAERGAVLHVKLDPSDSEKAVFAVRDLYVADGVLKHRDALLNTTVGEVAYVAAPKGETAPQE